VLYRKTLIAESPVCEIGRAISFTFFPNSKQDHYVNHQPAWTHPLTCGFLSLVVLIVFFCGLSAVAVRETIASYFR
jgi:hypothetical protein